MTGNGSKPRLQIHYETVVRPKLLQEFGYRNLHQVPRLLRIVVNAGLGEMAQSAKLLESVVDELAVITGQKPVVSRARKSIAGFNLRQGMPVGVSVTLRRVRMYEFLDRLLNVATPRMRDFRGFPTRSFDGRGNYTLGIKEQMVFPEIDYDKVVKIHGMDIVIVTTTDKDDEALALLREMGIPFRGETPVVVGGAELPGAA
ncbi:MAG: 50S ribosomal protein L5 [Gemmatimonadetes bacterium]|nr:50S ribosomal protein L5 [Gemmatimonadota bacterium]